MHRSFSASELCDARPGDARSGRLRARLLLRGDRAVAATVGRWLVCHPRPESHYCHHHDWQGRDWRDLNRRILCNTILTAFLRYPAWLVPVVVSLYAQNHLRRSRAGMLNPYLPSPDPEARADWAGVVWALSGSAQELPVTSHNRPAVRWKTIRRWRHLRERPKTL